MAGKGIERKDNNKDKSHQAGKNERIWPDRGKEEEKENVWGADGKDNNDWANVRENMKEKQTEMKQKTRREKQRGRSGGRRWVSHLVLYEFH